MASQMVVGGVPISPTPNSFTSNLAIVPHFISLSKTDKKVKTVLVFTNESVRSC